MIRTRVYGVWSTSVSVSYFIRRQEASAMQGPMTEHGRFQGSEWWQVDGLLWLTIHATCVRTGTVVCNYVMFDLQPPCFWKKNEKGLNSRALQKIFNLV